MCLPDLCVCPTYVSAQPVCHNEKHWGGGGKNDKDLYNSNGSYIFVFVEHEGLKPASDVLFVLKSEGREAVHASEIWAAWRPDADL